MVRTIECIIYQAHIEYFIFQSKITYAWQGFSNQNFHKNCRIKDFYCRKNYILSICMQNNRDMWYIVGLYVGQFKINLFN